MAKKTNKIDDDSPGKQKTSLNLDRKLWRKFGSRLALSGEERSAVVEKLVTEYLATDSWGQGEHRDQKEAKQPTPRGSAGKTTLENQLEITVLLTSLVEQTESIRQSQAALARSQTVLTKKLTGLSSEVAVVKTEIAGISAAWHEQTIAEQEELNRAPGDLKDNRNRLRADRNKFKEDKKNGETGEDSALPGTGTA